MLQISEPTYTLDCLLHDFGGHYTIHKTFSTHAGYQGHACVEPLARNVFFYKENGILRVNDQALESFRQYLFCFDLRQKSLSLFHDKGRTQLFQMIALHTDRNTLCGEGQTCCNQDTYQSTYTFSPNGRFEIFHDVSGPRKQYQVTSTYTKSKDVKGRAASHS